MGKYFGTDGVRGIANQELTPELAFKLGRVGGYVLTKNQEKAKVVVGRDTRISGYMLESALIAGLLSIGIEVARLGVITTPGVAYLTKALGAEAGIMISASHNPFADNGIKFFGADGFKLSDAQEDEIERFMDMQEDSLPRPTGEKVGTVYDFFEGAQKYMNYIKQAVDGDFTDLVIALDCANGATSTIGPYLFGDLEAEVLTIGNSPDGENINSGVGSTHPEALVAYVKEKGADIGLSFDGDGDRLIAIDENGEVVDGDQLLYIIGKYMKQEGMLKQDMIVSTVMSNLGFHKALEAQGIKSVTTAVGDRYVVEEMRKNGYNLGGEQSGHIVNLDYNTTGDGLLTGLLLTNIVRKSGKPLSVLAGEMKKFPQVLVNVKVSDKQTVMNHPRLTEIMQKIKTEMNGDGRLLVRPSGTEPLIRVMAEAATEQLCQKYVDQIVTVIQEIG
ncbi:MAG TPA: phosphoglucosamine mutase [Firmicutes bacterium]|nr:phosphoglucosamine mutase [Bacillota bacterium]